MTRTRGWADVHDGHGGTSFPRIPPRFLRGLILEESMNTSVHDQLELGEYEAGATNCNDSGLRGRRSDSMGSGFRDMSCVHSMIRIPQTLDPVGALAFHKSVRKCVDQMMYDVGCKVQGGQGRCS